MSAKTATTSSAQDEIRRARKQRQQAAVRARTANSPTPVDTNLDYYDEGYGDETYSTLQEQMDDSAHKRQEQAQRQFRDRQVSIARQHDIVTAVPADSLAEIVVNGVFNQYPVVYVARSGINRTQCAADIVIKTINEMLGSTAANSAEVKDAIGIARVALRESYDDTKYAIDAERNVTTPIYRSDPLTQPIGGYASQ